MMIETCECKPFLSCGWSKMAYEQIKNGANLQTLFKINICDKKKRHVWCCKNEKVIDTLA